MTACDFTLSLFVRVDDAMLEVTKHPLALLHPSEAVTIGMLYALRGGSFRAFDRWLRNELAGVFPHLPERTRLHRILRACEGYTTRFLAQPSFFGVLDSFGVELLHPRRLGRTPNQWARWGKSNGRWIAGAKLAVCINHHGQVVSWQLASANVSDLHFLPLAHALSGQSILLADQGFLLSRKPKKAAAHRRLERTQPDNVLICTRGAWSARRLIETVFALFTQVLCLKHLTQRQQAGVHTRVAFAIAAYNLCLNWTGKPCLKIAHLAL